MSKAPELSPHASLSTSEDGEKLGLMTSRRNGNTGGISNQLMTIFAAMLICKTNAWLWTVSQFMADRVAIYRLSDHLLRLLSLPFATDAFFSWKREKCAFWRKLIYRRVHFSSMLSALVCKANRAQTFANCTCSSVVLEHELEATVMGTSWQALLKREAIL